MRSTCLLCTIQLSHCGNFSDVLTSMCGVQKNTAPLTHHITHTSLFPREHASHVIRSILRIYKFNCWKTINNRHVLRVCCVCVLCETLARRQRRRCRDLLQFYIILQINKCKCVWRCTVAVADSEITKNEPQKWHIYKNIM